jgi:alpha-1,2-mannosyltransferase
LLSFSADSDSRGKVRPSNRSVAIQLWVIGALVPLAFIATGRVGEYDFAAFWVAANQALAGDAGAIYSQAATRTYSDALGLSGPTIFPYPPHALLLFLPFAPIDYIPAYLAWNVATAAFFYWAARPYLPDGLPPFLAALTPAALVCLDFGQTGLIFGALWLLAFRGQWAAVGLLTFKPHLGFLAILSLRGRRAFGMAALVALGLAVASLLIAPPAVWAEFVEHSIGHAQRLGAFKRWYFAGVTPAVGYGLLGWALFAIAGALLLARRVNAFTAATATFLISPYGFHYDMTVACLGFGLLAARHWDEMPVKHRIPIALGFLSPAIAISGTWWMPPLIGWALWAQTKYSQEINWPARTNGAKG